MWVACSECGRQTWVDGPTRKGSNYWHGLATGGHYYVVPVDVPDEAEPLKEKLTMPAKKEADHIGPDPIAWIERLMDVNDSSSFPPAAKLLINGDLCAMRERLRREKESGCA